MTHETRIMNLEKQFIEYSDKAQDTFFFIERGLTRNMPTLDLVEMKTGLVSDLSRMISADQTYMCIQGNTESHPNYDKFITYVKLAQTQLNMKLFERTNQGI